MGRRIVFFTDILAFIVLANVLQSALVQVIIFFKYSPELDPFAVSMWVMSNGLTILLITWILSTVLTSFLANNLIKIIRYGKIKYTVIIVGSILLLIVIITPIYVHIKYWDVNLHKFEYLNLIRDSLIGSVILLTPRLIKPVK